MNGFWRFTALLLLMSTVAAIDWWLNRAAATRWREYSFLLAAGFLGGLIGVANDLVTLTISPDYFVVGKGILADEHFRLHVISLGFQAGLVMGMVIGGVYLIANNPSPHRRSLPMPRLFRFALPPVLAAVLCAPIISWLISHWDPLNFRSPEQLGAILGPMQVSQFLAVWGLHLGMYAGGLLGTVFAVFAIRRKRIDIE